MGTTEQLVRDLVAGVAAGNPDLLAAVALAAGGSSHALLDRAAAAARTTRQRQVVAVVATYLRGDTDRALLLAHDHLADHADSPLVAHVAALLTGGELP